MSLLYQLEVNGRLWDTPLLEETRLRSVVKKALKLGFVIRVFRHGRPVKSLAVLRRLGILQ